MHLHPFFHTPTPFQSPLSNLQTPSLNFIKSIRNASL